MISTNEQNCCSGSWKCIQNLYKNVGVPGMLLETLIEGRYSKNLGLSKQLLIFLKFKQCSLTREIPLGKRTDCASERTGRTLLKEKSKVMKISLEHHYVNTCVSIKSL